MTNLGISKTELELAALRECMRAGDVAMFCKSIEDLPSGVITNAIEELAGGVHDYWLSEDEVENLGIVLSKEIHERESA